MTKKLITCLLCLLFIPYIAFAGITTPIDINSETKVFNISGESNVKNGEILLIVTKPGVNISNITPELVADSAAIVYVLETNANGEYSGSFYLPDDAPSGDYVVYAGVGSSAEFYYADSSEIDRCIASIATADITNIGTRLDYYTNTQKLLGLNLSGDYSAFSDAANSAMVDYINSSRPDSIAIIKDYFKKSVELAVLIKSTEDSKVEEILLSNSLGIDVEVDSALTSAMLTDTYLSLRDSSVTKLDKIKYTVRCATALCRINSATRSSMDSVLTKYNDVLGLNLLGDYAKLDKIEVNKALTEKGFTSIALVKDAFNKSVENVKSKIPVVDNNNDNATKPSSKPSSIINVSGGGFSGGTTNTNTVPPVSSTPVFNDLDDAMWAKDYINALASKNIINGVGDSKFEPNAIVTREQYIKMLIGAFNISVSYNEVPFKDIDSKMWYAPYVSTAFSHGIISGISETEFGIGEAITREQMAVMSAKIMEKNNIELTNAGLNFSDRAEVSSYAYESVAKLTGAGIINGMDSSRFAPKENLTRAQAAKVVYLIMKAGGYID